MLLLYHVQCCYLSPYIPYSICHLQRHYKTRATMTFLASVMLLSLALPLKPILGKNTDKDPLFLDCDASVYYNSLQNHDPKQWTRKDLHALVAETHRKVLPEVADKVGEDDIYEAIKELDAGSDAGTVQLIYRQTSVNATFHSKTWIAAPFWSTNMSEGSPLSSSPELTTDVHQIRPVDMFVLEEKKRMNFGMCDTVGTTGSCARVTPNSNNTTTIADLLKETAQDDKIWQPPQAMRGEIARALLYTELRYEGLTLQDCEPFGPGQMGYLAQLLQWNIDYPPSEKETSRNAYVCGRWQGNRNPFIDYPELATILHGSPQEFHGNTYASCFDLNTNSENLPIQSDAATLKNTTTPLTVNPTSSFTYRPDHCAAIGEGNLPFFLVNTQAPDEVLFLSLEKIPGNIELYLTDEAWNGREFVQDQPNEGTIVVSYWKIDSQYGCMPL